MKNVVEGKCRVCRDTFTTRTGNVADVPNVCGRPTCAPHAWTPVQWAGRARMAEARQAAGLPLDDTDRTALKKTTKDTE